MITIAYITVALELAVFIAVAISFINIMRAEQPYNWRSTHTLPSTNLRNAAIRARIKMVGRYAS